MTEHVKQPIVVTGVGAVLPTGRGIEPLWDASIAGKPALSQYRDPLVSTRKITHFGHVPPEVVELSRGAVPHKLRKYGTSFTFNAGLAVQDALAEVGSHWSSIEEDRRGLYVAQDDAVEPSLSAYTKALDQLNHTGEHDLAALSKELLFNEKLDPFTVIHLLNNNTLALVSIVYQFRGDCAALVQGESSAVAALARAQFSLRNGYCDVAVVVGAGSYNEPLRLAGHYALGHLTKGADGPSSLRSFDVGRDGTVLGEGAVALVLERADDAARRGATPLVEVCGTAVLPSGPYLAPSAIAERYRAMLDRHGFTPDQLGAVLADGKGTVEHDGAEAELLAAVLKGAGVPVSTVRPITGTLGAAVPLADLALAGRMFAENMVPPISNLRDPLSDQLDFVSGVPRARQIDSILSSYANFNGFASAVLAKRPSAT